MLEKLRSDVGVALQSLQCSAIGPAPAAAKEVSVDKKEVALWKLSPKVEKDEFRHWCDIVHTNLEAVHHLPFPKIVLDTVRRIDGEISADVWQQVIMQANAKLPSKKDRGTKEGMASAAEAPPGIDPWAVNLGTKWKFIEMGRFLWTLLRN